MDEAEGVESKERWVYVKVNMDGVMVGRKVCVVRHGGYLGLARQLEEMFGMLLFLEDKITLWASNFRKKNYFSFLFNFFFYIFFII